MTSDNPTPSMQSESIGELAKALSAAQAGLKPLKKSKEGKVEGISKASGKSYEYTYKYADLADVIESYRMALAERGLALIQATRVQDGHIVLVTKLLHLSGEWVTSEYPIPSYQKPQEMGSALTYARRYAVTALLGIAAEDDDDGKRAQDSRRKKPEASPAPQATEKAPSAPVAKPPADPLTPEDIERVGLRAKAAGFLKHSDVLPLVQKFGGGAPSLKLMDRAYLGGLLAELARLTKSAQPPTPEELEATVEEIFGPA